VEREERSIDKYLAAVTMDSWHRRAESWLGNHTPLASFFFVLIGDQVAELAELGPLVVPFGSDPEAKNSLPVFGRRQLKCTTTHKLPFALSSSLAVNRRCTFLRRAQSKTAGVDEPAIY